MSKHNWKNKQTTTTKKTMIIHHPQGAVVLGSIDFDLMILYAIEFLRTKTTNQTLQVNRNNR